MCTSKLLYAGLLATGLSVVSAHAAVITYNDNFTASEFTAEYGSVPYAVVTGTLSVSFDNTKTYVQSTAITASANIPFDDGPVKFDYSPASDTLSLSGTRLNIGIGVQNDTSNFFLTIYNASSSAPSGLLIYATTDPLDDSVYRSENVVLTPVAVSVAVPEPASLMVLASGLIGLAMTWRRRAPG